MPAQESLSPREGDWVPITVIDPAQAVAAQVNQIREDRHILLASGFDSGPKEWIGHKRSLVQTNFCTDSTLRDNLSEIGTRLKLRSKLESTSPADDAEEGAQGHSEAPAVGSLHTRELGVKHTPLSAEPLGFSMKLLSG
jgi:hypothetical protein